MGIICSKFYKFEKELPGVDGKVFVITGTTSGTGYIAAETVAKHGGEVLLLNRPSPRSKASYKKLQASVPDGKFVQIDCDLQDFASVNNAVEQVIKSKLGYKEIYCLSNNAGIMAVDDKVTKDGYDVQMQTNHLSHFLLTKGLFPLLLEGSKKHGEARIVQHSSIARIRTEHGLEQKYLTKHKDGELGGNESEGFRKGGPMLRYQHSKLANSVFTHALHDRLQSSSNEHCRNIFALSAHPGASNTNLADHFLSNWNVVVKWIVQSLAGLFMQSVEDGTMGLLRCMMGDKKEIVSGTLYGPKLTVSSSNNNNKPVLIPAMSGTAVPNPTLSYENDPLSKDMLWNLSEIASGIEFEIP